MSRHLEYRAAVAQAETSKATFFANARVARARISGDRLKSDARARVKQSLQDGAARAQETIQEHPVAVGVAGVGLVAFLFRRPLCRIFKRGCSRLKRTAQPAPASLGTRLKQKLYDAASAARLTGDLK